MQAGQREGMDMFRILSLDGGGIKGAFTASVLATLEEDTGCAVSDHFDLIVGTSTGGVLAIALGLGLPARAICEFYAEKGGTVFPSTSIMQRTEGWLRQWIKPKHSQDTLRLALTDVFGERKLGESKCRLVITTYDAIGGRIFLLKTAHHPRFKYDIHAPVVDVALSTAAAPTFFSAAKFPKHDNASYVDGGVWANNPTLVGVTEAVAFLGAKLEEIDVLSIGCTTTPFNIAQHAESGALQWNAGFIELMFEAQMEASLAQARLLVGGRVHRINITAKEGEYALDDATPEKIRRLITLGRGEAVKKANLEVVQSRFLNGTRAAPFKPFH